MYPELTTMLAEYGNIKSYLYIYGLTANRVCRCEEEKKSRPFKTKVQETA